MTAEPSKDVTEDAAAPAAGGAAEEETAPETRAEKDAAARRSDGAGDAPSARPRRRRRVRVIEVLDDEDLDEVLDAIEAEEDAAEESGERTVEKSGRAEAEEPSPRNARSARARPAKKDPPEEDDGGSRARRTPPGLERPRVAAAVVVLLTAALATLAIWQWRSASALSAARDAREEVAKVAAAYGDAALTYDAANYRSQMDKAQKLMGGDLLESFRTTTLPNLGSTFRDNPDVALSSKTNQVFVGSVDDRFATAVVSVDITVRSKQESTEQPATLLRLALAKIDGEWKVTKQYASGVNDQNKDSATLGAVPTGSPSPGATSTGKGGASDGGD
ncbi:hypothetical protein Arub01_17380 [Actinomadura rubrobrunea]|uniref:Mce-associated membrane protein n=1 Tax=Actinomadura rubrobrunea TaxID=115335 RepID=A0A9W6PS07_9ACTN|nr:hypothetical protein [Actinomadura rubrobrunea]GLW63494.1 hypothetical protein Arub01_17380 [Actinomadura rubrobrunea]